MTRPENVLVAVVALLDKLSIAYHVGGSFASSFHGTPRTTADLDLVIELQPAQVDALRSGLQSMFYVERDAMADAMRERRSFNAILLDGSFKVDFFILGTRDFDRKEFERAQLMPIGQMKIRLKTAEDLVLRKLEWYRAGGEASERQWRDVVDILRVSGPGLDWAYTDAWASSLGIADLLDRARAEAEQPRA
jgi:hypothetical protein